jgi:hypothetical protein
MRVQADYRAQEELVTVARRVTPNRIEKIDRTFQLTAISVRMWSAEDVAGKTITNALRPGAIPRIRPLQWSGRGF